MAGGTGHPTGSGATGAGTGGGTTRALKVREKNLGKGLAYTLTLVVFTVVMVQWVLPGVLGGITKRPEGAAYRYLAAVSGNDPEEVEKFGDPALAGELTDFRRVDDGKWFERIEVGRGGAPGELLPGSGAPHDRRVPVLVVRRDNEDPDRRTKVRLTALLAEASDGDWRVVGMRPRTGTSEDSFVPSEGGEYPARAPLSAWIAALLIGVGLTAIATLVLKAAPEPARAAPPAN